MGTPIIGETSGKIFFVDSTQTATKGDDAQHGNTPQSPFATIDFAIGQCVANRGDILKVLPGHAETITSAAGIAIDVAGVTVEGQGSGRDRPTITLATSTAASIDLLAANCRLKNVVVDMTGIDNIGTGGSALGGVRILAADCAVIGCELIIATSGNQIKNAIGVTTAAARAKILHNLIAGTATAGPNSAIEIYGAGALTVEGIEIGWNRIVGDFASAGIRINMTDVALNWFIHDNIVTATGTGQEALDIVLGSGSSGIIANNKFLGTDVTIVYATAAAGFGNIENYGYDINTDGLQGVLVPIVGSQLPEETSLVDQIVGHEFSWKQANYRKVTADFSSATWNTVATHEILTVSGPNRVIIIPECTTALTSGGAAELELGVEGDTDAFLGNTLATDIDQNEYWLNATPAAVFSKSAVVDQIVNGLDVGYEVTVAALTGGVIDFHIWTIPLAESASVVSGSGGSL